MSESRSHDFPSTIEIVESAQAGNEAALQDLVTRYLPRVRQIVSLRYGYRMKRQGAIDDYVQDAIVRVLGSLHNFEPQSEGTFRNWLARCVEREIIDQARKYDAQKRGENKVVRFGDCDSAALHSSIFAGDQPAPSAVVRAEELGETIREKLGEMPEHQRELIILRTMCGMSYGEVADELGLPTETAARMACSRALRALKAQIGVS